MLGNKRIHIDSKITDMKQTIICAIIALTLVACSNQPGFTIKGNCGDYDGIAVLSYLNPLDETR